MTTNNKTTRIVTARKRDHLIPGSRVTRGQKINRRHATLDGLVLVSQYGTLEWAGGTFTGEISIVAWDLQLHGRKYVVTVDGAMLFSGRDCSWFKTLEEAAAFLSW
jgi:hypothetical protein